MTMQQAIEHGFSTKLLEKFDGCPNRRFLLIYIKNELTVDYQTWLKGRFVVIIVS
jgi:hypothetical protein